MNLIDLHFGLSKELRGEFGAKSVEFGFGRTEAETVTTIYLARETSSHAIFAQLKGIWERLHATRIGGVDSRFGDKFKICCGSAKDAKSFTILLREVRTMQSRSKKEANQPNILPIEKEEPEKAIDGAAA